MTSDELLSETGPDRGSIDEAHRAYAAASPPRAPHKGFGFARERAPGEPRRAETRFTAWGAAIDSHSGLVGTPASKRLAILLAG